MIKASVIIPAHNAQKTIGNLLGSLINQNYPRKSYEIIVVDDASTDKTADIVKNYSVIYLKQKHRGAGAARNLGAKNAKGEVFIFTDSDCEIPNDWITNHLKIHDKEKNVGIIGGGVKPPRDGNLLAWVDFLSSWFNAHDGLKKHLVAEYLPSCNLSVKKDVFKRVGGFWEKRLTGEDVDFCLRARHKEIKIIFNPSLALWHKNPGLSGFIKHHFNWGYHAPFVRGERQEAVYHAFFSGGFLMSLVLFLPITFGYLGFLIFAWWRYQPLRFFICFPLIFLGRLTYSFGTIVGSYQKAFVKNDY